MVEKILSKHFAERTEPVQFLVIHCFALTVEKMIQVLDELGVSTHYIIDTKGRVIQCVPEDKVAWHAGKSFWRGVSGLNKYSIGIELQNETLGQTEYPQAQLRAFIKLAKKIIKKYHIPAENIIGHSDIAPTRKVDPGKAFPWKRMADEGIGLWYEGKNTRDILNKIGYDTTNLRAAKLAYNRHFQPKKVPFDSDIFHMEENLTKQI